MKITASVTTIVPCYNVTGTLKRAVASIIAQTVQPVEILLVDDGSTDDTAVVIREFESQCPNMIKGVFLTENKGPSFARNTGWNMARGEFVAFLDADDAWHPSKLAVQLNWFKDHPDEVFCGHQCTEWIGDHLSLPGNQLKARSFSLGDMLISNRFSTPSVIVRRTVKHRFPVATRYAEDYYLWLSIAAEMGHLHRIELPLAWYFKSAYGANGLSASLWAMEHGELMAIEELRRSGKISRAASILFSSLSVMKYFRRLLVNALRRIVGRKKLNL